MAADLAEAEARGAAAVVVLAEEAHLDHGKH